MRDSQYHAFPPVVPPRQVPRGASSRLRYWQGSLVLLLLCLASGCGRSHPVPVRKRGTLIPQVHVLLFQGTPRHLTITTSGTYRIINATGQVLWEDRYLPLVNLSLKDHCLYLGQQKSPCPSIQVVPGSNSFIKFGRRFYRGSLQIEVHKQYLQVSNILPIDAAIAGMLASQMPPQWPLAALAAQAVLLRTRLLRCAGYPAESHLITERQLLQAYGGITVESQRIWQAIKNTRGVVLMYQSALLETFWNYCCAGHTADYQAVFGKIGVTPLSGRICEYCQGYPTIQWQYQLSLAQLARRLRQRVNGLQIVRQDQFGRVLLLRVFCGSQHVAYLTAYNLRLSLGPKFMSTIFSIKNVPGGLVFQGKGRGHGLGMCQLGACVMAQYGFTCTDILQYYFPGVEIYRLW